MEVWRVMGSVACWDGMQELYLSANAISRTCTHAYASSWVGGVGGREVSSSRVATFCVGSTVVPQSHTIVDGRGGSLVSVRTFWIRISIRKGNIEVYLHI